MKSKLTPFTDEIIHRYQDGATAEELARAYDVGESTIRYFLRTVCSTPLRPPHRGSYPRHSQELEETVVQEYQAGDTITLIASRHTIGYDAVRSILKRHHAITGRRLRSASLQVPTSEAQLGYIAALVDGEGTIRNFEHTGRHRILVRIANTDRALMEWLSQFGGTIHWYEHPIKTHYKPGGTWTVSQAIDVYHLLIAIEPYMIVKRDKAQEAIRTVREHWQFS